MNKTAIVRAIIERLEADLQLQIAAAADSHNNATSDETKSEGKYDTRALESSYLAEGQGRIAQELAEALKTYRGLHLRHFAAGEPIALTALVELEQGRSRDLYFLGPRSGGLEVRVEERDILILTPQAPLGRALLGRVSGANVSLDRGRSARIVSVI